MRLPSIGRRDILKAAVLAATSRAPGQVRHWESQSPSNPMAIQIGDVAPGSATIWARSDRPSRMVLTQNGNRMAGPLCTPDTDFTGRMRLTGLPGGSQIDFMVHFEEIAGSGVSAPLHGGFRSAPTAASNIRFLWSGDMVGQGWGINKDRGGVRIFETMRQREPHFFIHSGDTIYADGPVPAEVRLADGSVWRNVTTEEKSKVAETLDEFRGAYRYNLMDDNVRRFSAEVAQIWQWDDHEVTNNWSPGKDVSADDRYKVKSVPLLVARGTKAFLDYAPVYFDVREADRIYRRVPYGPLLDVFVIDQRSFRAANSHNRQEKAGPDTTFLGEAQVHWLKQSLRQSRALWKVIASDMPLGLQVGDGRDREGRGMFENVANGNGPALGRELEIAGLLRFIKQDRILNTVWLTADTHYTAAHYYDPVKARFNDFSPFWEFMSGPLNAGTFGPAQTDDTFGIQVVYQKHPPKGQSNLSPAAGLQFFGEVNINGASGVMTVVLRDMAGTALYSKELTPDRA